MSFYSFKVRASHDVVLHLHFLAIGQGVDVFNLVVTDLPAFHALLKEEGVEVLETHQLDNLEPLPFDAIAPEITAITGNDPRWLLE